jgi:hypothetical protein
MNYASGDEVYQGDFVCVSFVDMDEIGEVTKVNNDSVNINIAGGSINNYSIEDLQLYERGKDYYIEKFKIALEFSCEQGNYFAEVLSDILPYIDGDGMQLLKTKIKIND